MYTNNRNPELSPWLRWFIVLVVVVLVIGSMLFFAPSVVLPGWPWKITPFNTRFLGAIYFSGLAGVLVLLASNRWAPARLALPMGMSFTAVVSVASFLYLGHFNFALTRTYLWFVLYVIPSLICAYFLWRYRSLGTAGHTPTPSTWRAFFLAEMTLLGLYGVALFAVPSFFSAFWPWKIDDFHGRVYSALFITAAVGAYVLARSSARSEYLMFGLTHTALGITAPLGVLIVDASLHRVDWSSPVVWVWMGACALMFVVGVGLLWQAYAESRASAPEPGAAT